MLRRFRCVQIFLKYVVANPVRGLLDRKRSEEHLPSSNESKRKTQTNKNDKEKGIKIAKYRCQKKIDDVHLIERVWHSASREPSDTLPGSQPCTQTRSIYHIPYSQGLSFHYRHNRRRLGSPWVGPINAVRKRLKLATVTPGALSTLSASSASLFFCR